MVREQESVHTEQRRADAVYSCPSGFSVTMKSMPLPSTDLTPQESTVLKAVSQGARNSHEQFHLGNGSAVCEDLRVKYS